MAVEPTQLKPTRKSSKTRDFTREYVSGGTNTFVWRGRGRQPLPHPFDDLSRRQGIEVYEKMMTDYQIASTMRLYKTAILEDGMDFSPAVTDPAEEGYDLAQEIWTEWRDNIKYMETDLNDVLLNMLDASAFGNKVAEQVYELYKNKLRLKALKVKPRESVAFVVDEFLNVLGLLGDTGGTGIVPWVANETNIIPREKFAILTFQPQDGDPRGTSLLRPAYEPWWRKRQIMPEFLKFLAQFAGPSIYAIAPEGAEVPRADDDDDDTEPAQTVEERLVETIINFRNGTAMALPFGTLVELIQSEGDGLAFLNAITSSDQAITKAILVQQLATEDSQFMARAAAQVHQDVLATLIRQGKFSVVRMMEKDVLRPWVTYNWGYEATQFCPIATLGEVEAEDMVALMNAVANLMGKGFFVEEQMPFLDRQLGFPTRRKGAKRVMPVVAPQNKNGNQNQDDSQNQDDDADKPDSEDDSEDKTNGKT